MYIMSVWRHSCFMYDSSHTDNNSKVKMTHCTPSIGEAGVSVPELSGTLFSLIKLWDKSGVQGAKSSGTPQPSLTPPWQSWPYLKPYCWADMSIKILFIVLCTERCNESAIEIFFFTLPSGDSQSVPVLSIWKIRSQTVRHRNEEYE